MTAAKPPTCIADDALPAVRESTVWNSSLVETYRTAVFISTGLSLAVISPGSPLVPAHLTHNWCRIACGRSARCAECLRARAAFTESAGSRRSPHVFMCFCGQVDCALVLAGEHRHSPLLWSGPASSTRPTEEAFRRALRSASRRFDAVEEVEARRAFFSAPVVEQHRLRDIVAGLAFHLAMQDRQSGRPKVATNGGLQPPAVARARAFVEMHSHEPVTAADVAAHAGVDESHLSRLFKRACGHTITSYLAQVHVDNAKELLACSRLPITEIAFAAGFGSIARFNAVFRQRTGITPSEYREHGLRE